MVLPKLRSLYNLDMYGNEEDRRMARIALNVLGTSELACLAALLIDLIWWQQDLALVLVAAALSLLLPLALLLQGRLHASSFLLVTLYIFATATLATIGGGVHDYAVMLFPVIIMLAGLTAQKRGLIFSTLLTVIALLWLVGGQMGGWFSVYKSYAPDGADFLNAVVIIVLAAWAVFALVSNEQHGLVQSWRELAERKRAEAALARSETRYRHISATISDIAYSCVHDQGGFQLDWLSGAVEQSTGYSAQELIASGCWGQLVLPEDFHLFESQVVGLAPGNTGNCELRIQDKQGQIHWLHSYAECVEEDGQSRLYGGLVDITERKQMEEVLWESEEKLKEIFDNSLDNIFVIDVCPDGRFRINTVNSTLAKIFNTDQASLAGKYFEEILDAAHTEPMFSNFRQCIASKTNLRYEEAAELPGTTLYYSTHLVPIFDKSDHVIRLIGISRDITERKKIEQALQESEMRYRIVADHTNDWAFWIAPDGHFIYSSPACQRITGYAAEEFLKDPGLFKSIIHPDDLQIFTAHHALTTEQHVPDEIHFRIVLPDGTERWIEHACQPIFDETNTYLGVRGSNHDITERKQAEQAVQEMWLRLQGLGNNLETAALYIYSHNLAGQPQFEYLSAGMEKLTGAKYEEVLQDASILHALILPEYLSRLVELESHSKATLTSFELEVQQRHALTGEIRWALLRSTPRRRPDGSTVWYGVQMDITDRKKNEQLIESANEQLRASMKEVLQLQADLREQALRDPLTGLYNRRYLDDTLMREVNRAEHLGQPFSLIMMDIDHFKEINDAYGHPVGDLFIVEIASLLKQQIRQMDTAYRYGGEEFLLILSGATVADAVKRAEEIRLKCAQIHIIQDDRQLEVTLSLGIATFPLHNMDARKVLIMADKALYKSKNAGRNRVMVWEE